MTTRPNENFSRSQIPPRVARFVLVNERVPRGQTYCATCCVPIERGYVRDPATRLLYCGTECFGEHESADTQATARTWRVS